MYIYIWCARMPQKMLRVPLDRQMQKKLGDFLSTHWKQATSPHVVEMRAYHRPYAKSIKDLLNAKEAKAAWEKPQFPYPDT